MTIESLTSAICEKIAGMPEIERIAALNAVRTALHEVSPFVEEPVDLVLWIPAEKLEANDYNPNSVAPKEMSLLEHSIREDGYTQPIVAFEQSDAPHEVVDGFHRNRVGRDVIDIRARILGHLPVVKINGSREGRSDRIAATIRHNRARGRHGVTAMSDIVIELARRNWSDARIAKELGMDPDEVLRLKQISGLAEMFADRAFSEAWEAS